ncbi:MAG: hypothetical protein AB7W06_17425 [Alphaproteobacteria bacterium]
MIEGKDRAESIRLTAEHLGMSLVDAAFIAAIEAGEIDGDSIAIDEETGKPVKRRPYSLIENPAGPASD